MENLIHRSLVMLLAGGAGERLFPLTRHRAKPAVPFGGNYRIIDVTMSNCVNSGIRRFFILTQYKSLSLNRHIRNGWYNVVAKDLDEFIEIIPPQKRVGESWYVGTADAVWQNLYSIRTVDLADYVVILAGDHIYKMNYFRMLQQHVESQADATIGATEVPLSSACRLGVLEVDSHNRITAFVEKPSNPKPLPSDPAKVLVSMGIYIFNKCLLIQALEEDARAPHSSHDFGRDIIPALIQSHGIYAHHFIDENKKEETYWLDVGTIDAYYEANMDLVAVNPKFNLYDQDWPIRTYQRQYPPAKFVFAQEGFRVGVALNSIVSHGVIVSGGRVVHSILSPGVHVHSYSDVDRCILFAHADVGEHSRIRNCIVESGVRLPRDTIIGYDPEDDRRRFHVTESGITVVTQEDLPAEEL